MSIEDDQDHNGDGVIVWRPDECNGCNAIRAQYKMVRRVQKRLDDENKEIKERLTAIEAYVHIPLSTMTLDEVSKLYVKTAELKSNDYKQQARHCKDGA